MGNFLSSVNAATEAVAEGDLTNGSGNGSGNGNGVASAYRFPPKSGTSYFANHFIMGGEKFDSPQPESFLFGENSDLNFLGSEPVPFPYPPPATPTEATKTLKSLVNIRRDSLHFVLASGSGPTGIDEDIDLEDVGGPAVPDEVEDEDEDEDTDADETTNVRRKDKRKQARKNALAAKIRNKKRYNVEFTFDCDVDCAITIYYLCTEDITTSAATYTPVKPHYKSNTYVYTKGAGKLFSQPGFVFHPGLYVGLGHTMNAIDPDAGTVPLVIQCVALSDGTSGTSSAGGGGGEGCQSHTTLAVVEATSDGMGYMLKPLKQKLFVDGLCYLLQEIYGLENKAAAAEDVCDAYDEDIDDSGADCVVCMCELRDTIILPCRHLCLCFACADSLRFQANNCPICRAPFRALLQIRAVQRISHTAHPALAGTEPVPQEGVPPGYTAISLVDALNGPINSGQAPPPPPPVIPPPSSSNSHSSKKRRKSSKDHQRKTSAATGSGSQGSTLEIVDETTAEGAAAGGCVKITRGSTLSVDVVDEELAKMAVAESLTDLSEVVKEDDVTRDGDDDVIDEDDEAVIVTSALPSRHKNRYHPGTPCSTRSSQDSSSSTKRLLPSKPMSAAPTTPDDVGSIVTTTTAAVDESPRHEVAPPLDLKIVPQSAATVVNVAPSNEESC